MTVHTSLLVSLVLVSVEAFSSVSKTFTLAPSTPEERSKRAQETWQTIALAPIEESRRELISLDNNRKQVKIYDEKRFEDFKTIRGTYYINGLSECKIGDRLIHPFEAHGLVKSLAFDGSGSLLMKTAVVQTPLTKWERRLNMPLARGVMNSLTKTMDIPGCLLNALASSERDTANLVATLWPPSGPSEKQVLIVGGDNGTPYAVDPASLKTLGPLEDHVPALKKHLSGKKLLAHNRIDEDRQRIILCSSSFDIPGDGEGNTIVEFMEFDVNFQLVSSRRIQTRFMVFHDWMLTDNFYVVPLNPAKVQWDQLAKFATGQGKCAAVR